MRLLLILLITLTITQAELQKALLVDNNKSSKPFIVAIDPGHTKKYSGALSASGQSEHSYNLKMANILLKDLNSTKNINAFIINSDGGSIKLKERTAIAMKKNADIFISIHHDSVQPQYLKSHVVEGKKLRYTTKYKGYSIFVSKKNTKYIKSFSLAKEVGKALLSDGFVPTLHHAEKIKGENRELLDRELGVYRFDNLVVLKTADIPTILLECGVIVNPEEEKLISESKYHQNMAKSLNKAVQNFILLP